MTFDVDKNRVLSCQDDAFVMTNIPKKLQDFEHDLYASKWFDYRRMTPMEATGAYIDAYGTAYSVIYAREIDFEAAKHIIPLGKTALIAGVDANKPKFKRKLTGFWRGRQIADAIGMPYSIYLEHAFEYRMRKWQRAYLPQPEHLYHEYDVEKVIDRWAELQLARLYLPDDPAFMNQNYIGIPYQNDFHEWLFLQAANRGDDPQFIADLVDRDILPIDKVAARFSPDFYKSVESRLG